MDPLLSAKVHEHDVVLDVGLSLRNITSLLHSRIENDLLLLGVTKVVETPSAAFIILYWIYQTIN